MSDGTITSALKEAMKYNILSYEKGNSYKKANEYFIHDESEWTLPQKVAQSKKRTSQKIKGVSPKNRGGSGPENDVEPPQVVSTNKNYSNNNNANQNSKIKQSISSKNIPTRSLDRLDVLTDAINRYYSFFFQKHLQVPYPKEFRKQLDVHTANHVLDRYLEYVSIGGSLFGLGENEFIRLTEKPERHPPQPRFLTTAASKQSYLMTIKNQLLDEKLKTCFGPIDTRQFSRSRSKDKSFNLISRGLKHLLSVGSVERYVEDSLDARNKLPLLGPYLFKYAIVKEYHALGHITEPTEKVVRHYFKSIGHENHHPFENQLNPRLRSFYGDKIEDIFRGAGLGNEIGERDKNRLSDRALLFEVAKLKIPEPVFGGEDSPSRS